MSDAKSDRRSERATPRILIAHPSPDLYGSDLQMASAAAGLSERGWHVDIVLPRAGRLEDLLTGPGEITKAVTTFPVLRRASLHPRRLIPLLVTLPMIIARLRREIRRLSPDVVYVNTVTIPWWIFAARLAGVPVVVHVREAEEEWPAAVRLLLAAPLLAATSVITNSKASLGVLTGSLPRLAKRADVIYNGIAGPDQVGPPPATSTGVNRLTLVARLSARKGVDVALEALALLRGQGRPVELDICGTAYSGYEWFEQQLHERAAQPDLAGAVKFHGYVNPTWALLSSAAVVLVPSRAEPFGNTAVEAQLAQRPVVASRVQGLPEIVEHERTGLLVDPGDAQALAAAIVRLIDEPDFAIELAAQGRTSAVRRFNRNRYREEVDALMRTVAGLDVVGKRTAKG